jgi:hypothetical protein
MSSQDQIDVGFGIKVAMPLGYTVIEGLMELYL